MSRMSLRNFVVGIGIVVLTFCSASMAAAQTQLVGVWERTSLLDAEGKPTQPPTPAAFLIFTADGFWAQNAIPTGRAKVTKSLDQMTKEELLQRYTRLEARRGTYTTSGNRLTRKNIASVDPNQEGTDQVQLFKIEAGALILSSADPKLKNEARFRRAK